MKITRAYEFQLYPSKEQEQLISKTFGCKRFVYNYMLDLKKKNPSLGRFDMNKKLVELKSVYSFLKEVDSTTLQNAIKDLDVSFMKHTKEGSGYPKFKKKGLKESYRTNNTLGTYKEKAYQSIEIDLQRRIIKLPKLKEVPIRGYRNLEYINGHIFNATIKRVGNKYYVCVCIEEEVHIPEFQMNSAIGIDVGIKNNVVTSDGETYNNVSTKDQEKHIEDLQAKLSKKEKGSQNYLKALKKLERAYQKLRNMRKKFAEHVAKEVTKNHDILIMEHLNVKEMLKKKEENNKRLRKGITNATFTLLKEKIKYKCFLKGKKFYQINTYYPSSQLCSRCKTKRVEMKDLKLREYECVKCGIRIDRDYNASLNILDEGMKLFLRDCYKV